MEKVSTILINMKANLSTIKERALVISLGQVETNTEASLNVMSVMVTEKCIGVIVVTIKVIGLREFNMDMEDSHLLMVQFKKDSLTIMFSKLRSRSAQNSNKKSRKKEIGISKHHSFYRIMKKVLNYHHQMVVHKWI